MTRWCRRPSALVTSHQRLRHMQPARIYLETSWTTRHSKPPLQLARIYLETLSTTRHSKTPLPRISLPVHLRIPAQSPRLIMTTPIRAVQVLLLGFLMQRQRTHFIYFIRQSGRKLQTETSCFTELRNEDGMTRWRLQIKRGLSP